MSLSPTPSPLARLDPEVIMELTLEGGPAFPSTAWSNVLAARDPARNVRDPALERLLGIYYRPVFWTFRLDWHIGEDEAHDLTQEFFSAFLERQMLSRVSREKGRLRTYVKVTIKHFMISRQRHREALKRGGGQKTLNAETDFLDDTSGDPREEPERHFERTLGREILRQALEMLREQYARRGALEDFELFVTYYQPEPEGEPFRYEDLTERFEITKNDVKNRLARLRWEYKRLVLELLRDGVSTEEELLDELREIFS